MLSINFSDSAAMRIWYCCVLEFMYAFQCSHCVFCVFFAEYKWKSICFLCALHHKSIAEYSIHYHNFQFICEKAHKNEETRVLFNSYSHSTFFFSALLLWLLCILYILCKFVNMWASRLDVNIMLVRKSISE